MIRDGIYQVFPRMGHLDLLSSAKLHSAIRGPARLTSEIVLNGTRFSFQQGVPTVDGAQTHRRWYGAAVGAMTEPDRRNLVKFITGVPHPPISYARPGSKWMKVHFGSGEVVSVPRVVDGTLNLPQYQSGEQLATALREAIILSLQLS